MREKNACASPVLVGRLLPTEFVVEEYLVVLALEGLKQLPGLRGRELAAAIVLRRRRLGHFLRFARLRFARLKIALGTIFLVRRGRRRGGIAPGPLLAVCIRGLVR